MTAIERHRAERCNEAAVLAAEALLDEAEAELIYYAAVSLNGRVLTKVVPRRHFRRNLARGVQLHASAIADLTTSIGGDLLGGGAEAPELTAMPDPATLVILPWDRKMAFVFCDLFVREDSPKEGGEHSPLDVRGILRARHAAFQATTGFTLKSGCEPEMAWISDTPPFSRPGLAPNYHFGTLDAHRELVQRVVAYGMAMGLDMIEADYEDIHQIELNWMFDNAELTADRLIMYRMLCRQVGREFGVIATFMPKPATGVMGNGCHHNISLWAQNQNIFEDPSISELHVTDEARWSIGGILQYSGAAMAIMAPTVNSYKRFADLGQFAPIEVNWGLDNKTCTVRVSASGRLEYKLPDASVNPYLSHAVVLEMLERGLSQRIDPGAPSERDSAKGDTSVFPALSKTLGDSVAAAAGSDLVTAAIGAPMASLFLEYKSDEWHRYCAAVTDWDRAHYLEFLP